jgi:hypothetical protein
MKIALILLGAIALVWPALYNGYPLTFQDSAWYLSLLSDRPIHPGRTIGFSFFADAVTWWPSLWPIIAGQALVTSALIVRCADLAAGKGRSGLKLAAISLATVIVFTGLAKYVSWLMADLMTGWLFLAGLIWMLSDDWIDRCIAAAVTALAVMAHNTHLPLALGMAGVVAIGSFTLLPKKHPGRRAASGLLLMGLLMIAWVPTVNFASGLGATYFRGSGSFLMYRFIDSGVMIETLDAYCDERDWHSCDYRDEFTRHVGRADGWFLFRYESPFFTQLGGWQGDEQGEIVAHAFRCCWPSIVSTSIAGAWEQFWRIDSRDGVAQIDTGPIRHWLETMKWAEFRSLMAARQARGEPVRVTLLPLPEIPTQIAFGISAIGLGALGWRRGDRRIAFLLGGVLVFLVGNAMICSFGSSIHDRYQGRIAWLLPWAMTLSLWWWLKNPEADAGTPIEAPA